MPTFACDTTCWQFFWIIMSEAGICPKLKGVEAFYAPEYNLCGHWSFFKNAKLSKITSTFWMHTGNTSCSFGCGIRFHMHMCAFDNIQKPHIGLEILDLFLSICVPFLGQCVCFLWKQPKTNQNDWAALLSRAAIQWASALCPFQMGRLEMDIISTTTHTILLPEGKVTAIVPHSIWEIVKILMWMKFWPAFTSHSSTPLVAGFQVCMKIQEICT